VTTRYTEGGISKQKTHNINYPYSIFLMLMERSINIFRKTDHFMWRQWNRNVEDSFLEKILPQMQYATRPTDNRNALVISQKCLAEMKKQGIDVPQIHRRQHLVVIWKAHLLITVYIYTPQGGNDFDLLRRLHGCTVLIC
jgi:hypothetical protein